eukprot:TRINITY_DN14182_c0_g1_i2.p1 TRINITY_DN14182_c0_g1~~TRINITY_DN14182_c0_g1_i2.p1  ORF type:complete len:162 (+),score=24.25 TRINITY_DN14182_c0_g1_i2:420-905(+)
MTFPLDGLLLMQSEEPYISGWNKYTLRVKNEYTSDYLLETPKNRDATYMTTILTVAGDGKLFTGDNVIVGELPESKIKDGGIVRCTFHQESLIMKGDLPYISKIEEFDRPPFLRRPHPSTKIIFQKLIREKKDILEWVVNYLEAEERENFDEANQVGLEIE